MPYPTEGEASVTLTAGVQRSNTISLITPHEAAGIPTGATFDSMSVSLTTKKTGTFSVGTNLSIPISSNLSTTSVASGLQTVDETFQTFTFSGDRSYWKISSTYSLADIITKLKDGSMTIRTSVATTAAIACNAKMKNARIIITYSNVEGKRGAILTTLL